MSYEDVVDNLHAKEDYFRYKTFNYSLNKILKYLNISNLKIRNFRYWFSIRYFLKSFKG